MNWDFWRSRDERLRRAAATWFGRMQGPNASNYEDAFDVWKSDPDNAQAYERLVGRWRESYGLADSPIARSSRLEDAPLRPAIIPRRVLLAALPLALLTVGGGLWVGLAPDHLEAKTLSTQRGQIRTTELSDGSRVTLDTSTSLSLHYSRVERRLRLISGRARFDVAHDASRRFIVETANGQVIAHGTRFDIAVQPGRAHVVLLHGAIEVAIIGNLRQSSAHLSLPGDQIDLVENRPLPKPARHRLLGTRWPEGVLDFSNTPLSEAIAEINRYNRAQLRINDARVASLRVTGAFHGGDPASFSHAVTLLFHLHPIVRSQGDIVLAP